MNERLKDLYYALLSKRIIYSQADFARQIGKSRGTMSQMLKGSIGVSRDTLETICDQFPFVNKKWLLTGDGNMFKEETPAPAVSIQNVGNVSMENSQNVGSSNAELSEEIAALKAENKSLKEQIEWLRSMLQK